MTRRAVAVGDQVVTINTDDAPPGDLFTSAVLRTRVIDELTLEPPRVRVTLRNVRVPGRRTIPRCSPRFAGDGICGFVGRPRDVAYELLHAGSWSARIEAPGYLSHDLTPAIDRARRGLGTAVVPPASLVQLSAPTGSDAEQFAPGRGVLVERHPTIVNSTDEFGTAQGMSPPPPLGDVPLVPPLREPHPVGRVVSGVPIVVPDRPLHRAAPVRIRGRVQRRSSGGILVPAPAASIGIRGVWLNYPAATSSAPVAIGFCTVEPPLYFDYALLAGVNVTTMAPVGSARSVLDSTDRGARVVTIAPNGGLAPLGGDRMQIEDPSSAETEIVVSDGFDPVADPAAPVAMRLRTPTAYAHRRDALAQAVNPGVLVPAGTITREAQAGDAVLFASNLAALTTTTGTIGIEVGTAQEAWHTAIQPPTTPNDLSFQFTPPIRPDGRFEWPAVARVAQLRVRALLAGYAPIQLDLALEYGADNPLSILFIS